MRILISPAKKMNVDTDSLPWTALPFFLSESALLLSIMKNMSAADLKRLWNCNDKIAAQNIERLKHMELTEKLTPAILAYEGIQYQYMAPGVFTDQELDYVQRHLRILSGFYGVLKPFDGVTPYRLEMQAKLSVGCSKNLYEFWGDRLARLLLLETNCVVNLASKEYSTSVSKHLPRDVQFITCVFGQELDGKVVEKGTLCKMARGEMVRYMAEHQVDEINQLKGFDRMGYSFRDDLSDEQTFVFIQGTR